MQFISRQVLVLIAGIVTFVAWAQDSRISPSTWVQVSGTEYPDDDVGIQYSVMLTETYLRVAEPQQAVRLLSVSTCLKSGEVLLRQHATVKGLGVSDSDPHSIVLGPVNLGVVETFAAQALGLPEIEAGNEETPRYEMLVSPANGKTWGDVAARADLLVTVSVAK